MTGPTPLTGVPDPSTLAVATIAGLAVGLVAAVVTAPILHRLPEPAPDVPGAATKTPYAALARPRFIGATALAVALAGTLGWIGAGAAGRHQWLVLAGAGGLLAAIDGATTWLPLRLTYAAWVLMAAATALGTVLGGGWSFFVRAAAGALVAGVLYWIAWAISRGGFGFGDVRFAPLVGAAAGGHSWSLLLIALTLGSAIGAGIGLVRLLARRRGPFPYAPALLAGPYVALLAEVLTGTGAR